MTDSALREHEEALRDGRLLLASNHDAIFSADLDGRLWIWNRGSEALYGRPAEEVRGRHLEFLFHPTELPRLLGEIVPEVLRDGRRQTVLRQLRAGGEEIVAEVRCECLRDDSGSVIGWLGCARDLTTQQRDETSVRETRDRLLEVSEKLVRVQESERRRIARELHDDLGQRLTVLTLNLSALRSGLPDGMETTAAGVKRLQVEAGNLVRDLSGLSHELHPVSFDHQGFISQLKSYCGELSLRTRLDIDLVIENGEGIGSDLPPTLRLGLFRIVQEALRNVLVHSGAGAARVTVARHGDELRVTIEDRGRGFEKPKPGGLGLLSMGERARLFAGELEIHSRPGEGTKVEVRAPLRDLPARDLPAQDLPARDGSTLEGDAVVAGEPVARRIGPYSLLKRLGQGSMGVVYLAEQKEPVPRRVALKLLRTPMAEGKELLRFDVERRALGRMEHPNIASIYDAEITEEGDPYLVMEHIDGLPITEYCDQRRTGLDSRLDLFIATCHGVGHAHQKRIIHRDIKPSNVLVGEQDGLPVPKVIDFGIAKAIDHPLAGGTVALTGQSLVGSPVYLSPEVLHGGEADVRSDIYALGVLLYELLVGDAPFVLDEATLAQSFKELIERGSFRRPSEHWRSLEPAVRARRAERRGAEAGAMERRLRGDLDNIVMKSLAEEPERRYTSAGELAADLERYLHHEPVLASPPSRLYAFGKFVRRHRLGVAAATLIFLAVAMGLVATTQEARRANREATTAEQVTRFITEMFEASSPYSGVGAEITVRDLLDRGAEKAQQQLVDQPQVRARLLSTLGITYHYLGVYDQALPMLEESLAIQDALESNALGRATTLRYTAAVLIEQSHFEQAEERLLRAFDLAEQAGDPDHLEVGKIRRDLAHVLCVLGRLPEAREHAEVALVLFEKVLGPSDPEVAEGLFVLGLVAGDQGDFDFAEETLKRAIEIPRLTIRGHVERGTALLTLAELYRVHGRRGLAVALQDEGIGIFERYLGSEHPFIAAALALASVSHMETGRFERAEEALRRIVEIQESTPGGRDLDFVSALGNLAAVYFLRGDVDRPEPLLRQALGVLDEVVGLEHGRAAGIYWRLGVLYQERGDFAVAESQFLKALEVYADGPVKDRTARFSTDLGNLYCDLGKPELAAPLLTDARAYYESKMEQVGSDKGGALGLARASLALGRMHDLRGEPEAAGVAWELAVELMEPMLGSGDLGPKRLLAAALLRLGRVEEAAPVVEDLRNLGLRLPSFVKLCRDAGLPME